MDLQACSSRWLQGAVTNGFYFVAALGISFFLSPYYLQKLGEESYGLWILVESFLAYLTLFDLGISTSALRFFAKFRTGRDCESVNRLYSTTLILLSVLGILVFVVGLLCILFFLNQIRIDQTSQDDVKSFALYMLCSISLTLPFSLFSSMLDGVGAYFEKTLIRSFFLIVRTICIVIYLQQNSDLVGLAIILTVNLVVEHLVLICLVYRYYPSIQFSWKHIDRSCFQQIRRYSKYVFLLLISGRICIQSGPILIGLFLTVPQVAWFALALRLVEYAKSLIRSVSSTLAPEISSLDCKQDHEKIRRLYLHASKWALYAIMPIQLGLLFFGKAFLILWLGSWEQVQHTWTVLLLLSMPLSISVAQSIAARVCYGTGNLKRLSQWSIGQALITFCLGCCVLPIWGIEGMALAIILPECFFSLLCIRSVCQSLDISWSEYFRDCWVQPLVMTFILGTVWSCFSIPMTRWSHFGLILLITWLGMMILIGWLEGWIYVPQRRWKFISR